MKHIISTNELVLISLIQNYMRKFYHKLTVINKGDLQRSEPFYKPHVKNIRIGKFTTIIDGINKHLYKLFYSKVLTSCYLANITRFAKINEGGKPL